MKAKVKTLITAASAATKRLLASALFFFAVTLPVYAAGAAGELDIRTGLGDAGDKAQLAEKIRFIGLNVGSFIGVIAVCAMIFCAFRLATARDERGRADAISHMMWAIGAVIIVGLALAIVGFVANLVKPS
ncbi:MAG: hypothetical protein PWQ39_190 [Thermacetogenium sp.]|nr:hypothetical protein [Thermacetogenium sp.]